MLDELKITKSSSEDTCWAPFNTKSSSVKPENDKARQPLSSFLVPNITSGKKKLSNNVKEV